MRTDGKMLFGNTFYAHAWKAVARVILARAYELANDGHLPILKSFEEILEAATKEKTIPDGLSPYGFVFQVAGIRDGDPNHNKLEELLSGLLVNWQLSEEGKLTYEGAIQNLLIL